VGGVAIRHEQKLDTDTIKILRDTTTKDLPLVGKINLEMFNLPQWLPSNVNIDIKLKLAPSNFNGEGSLALHLMLQSLSPRQNFMFENNNL